MENPIGLFDSGVGGLTVLTSIQKALPKENIIYIGDNAHCPYGDKTKQQLLLYTKEICDYFVSRNVKMIVLACNTTSANVLKELQQIYPDTPIIGVVYSTVNDFLSTRKKHVLVIATHATVQSHQYRQLIHKCDPTVQVYELETPKLVPLIESGLYKTGIGNVLNDYLQDYKDKVDCLILGCTHYPIILSQIQDVFVGKEYISSSCAVCHDTKKYLEKHNLLNHQCRKYVEIYTTGCVEEFYSSSKDFFDYQNLNVKHLSLNK